MYIVKDITVVVTGGANGLGLEIACKFLENGAKNVILLDIDEEKGLEAENQLNAKHGEVKSEFIKCDVTTDLENVSKRILNTYKNIDVLVNNAGIVDDVDVQKTISINVEATMKWSFAFWEHMRKDKGGKGGTIINLSSAYGFRPDPYYPVYVGTKFAVLGFSKSLGHQSTFKFSGIRVLALCPSFTDSTNLGGDMKIVELREEFKEYLNTSAIWQKPEAVGKAAVEIYQKAESGTAWLIEGGKPLEQV